MQAEKGGGWRRKLEVFTAFLALGCTSFGGPVAHLGYFRREFVERRHWLDESAYADLIALCQFLPGPASSQMGMALGVYRAGLPGSLLAWLGFTLPSAALMTLAGLGVAQLGDLTSAAWVHGLQLTAVAVVAHAVWSMGQALSKGAKRFSLTVAAAMLCLFWNTAIAQLAAIVLSAALGIWLLRGPDGTAKRAATLPIYSRWIAVLSLTAFAILLFVLPMLAAWARSPSLQRVDSFYRAGALVFGGGHVVLPLLQQEVVPHGWLSNDVFLAGYGLAQAMPGPLFTFAAFLGAAASPAANGVASAIGCLVAIFLPAYLLVIGALPIWERLRHQSQVRAALYGVNAAVVGILFAALYDPIFLATVHSARDLAVAVVGFTLLAAWRVPSWLVVVLCTALAITLS